MTQDEMLTNVNVQNEDGKCWLMKYYLRTIVGEGGKHFYALRVDQCDEAGTTEQTDATPAFTSSLDEAKALAERFARGTVMPCVLLEMVDDWAS